MDLLKGLNPPQLDAVVSRSNALLVLAGAGSGKTGVLTRRIAYLIQERGVSPHNILALTFTRKAAQEMKDRLETMLDKRNVGKIWIGTFHAISLRILEQYGYKLGYSKHISIYDEIDQLDILGAIIDELGLKINPKQIAAQLQGYASDCDKFEFADDAKTIIAEYRVRLKMFNAVDFSLLLTETLRLFREHPEVYNFFHDKFRYVFVDEYQDVDRTQYYLHEALHPENIFVVGDVDQAIYKFRGSDIQIVMDFEKNHSGAEIMKLEQSYRCPAEVIDSANDLIKNNPQRYDKTLWTNNEKGKTVLSEYPDAEMEADEIRKKIKKIIGKFEIEIDAQGKRAITYEMKEDPFHFDDITILTRTHAQQESLAGALKASRMPFKVIGAETNFWKTDAARTVIAILKVLHNKKDSWHFMKIAKSMIYQLSEEEWLEAETEAMKLECRTIDYLMKMRPTKFNDLYAWYQLSPLMSLPNLIEEIFRQIDVRGYYEQRDLFHKALIASTIPSRAKEWFDLTDTDGTMPSFLEWVADRDIQKEVDNQDMIKIATIHAVKGLEFPIVFITGLNEGKIPHARTLEDPEEVQEERRLMYVAITRVKKLLFMSYNRREIKGMRSIAVEPSRFINEMNIQSPIGEA